MKKFLIFIVGLVSLLTQIRVNTAEVAPAKPLLDQQLIEAAKESSGFLKVYSLLDSGANPNTTDPINKTPLMFAAQKGHLLTALALIEKKAQIDAKNRFGWTALFYATHKGNRDLIPHLLKHRANPNETDNLGNTPLIIAAKKGYTTIVELLLEADADPFELNHRSESALSVATEDVKEIIHNYLTRKKVAAAAAVGEAVAVPPEISGIIGEHLFGEHKRKGK